MFPFKTKIPLTTREWWLIIFGIALLELLFLHFVYTNGRNEDAFTYFSFAATLISIVLAVIAIVYGFIQTLSQQSATDRITRGVAALERVIGQIEASESSLAEGLGEIADTADKLDAILREVGSTRGEITKRLGELDARIDTALNQKPPPEEVSVPAPQIATDAAQIKSIFRRFNQTARFVATILNLARDRGMTENELFEGCLWKSYTLRRPRPSPIMKAHLRGWFFSSLRTFNALGWLVSAEKKVPIVTDLFSKEIAAFLDKPTPFTGDFFPPLFQDLQKLIKDGDQGESISASGEDTLPVVKDSAPDTDQKLQGESG